VVRVYQLFAAVEAVELTSVEYGVLSYNTQSQFPQLRYIVTILQQIYVINNSDNTMNWKTRLMVNTNFSQVWKTVTFTQTVVEFEKAYWQIIY